MEPNKDQGEREVEELSNFWKFDIGFPDPTSQEAHTTMLALQLMLVGGFSSQIFGTTKGYAARA